MQLILDLLSFALKGAIIVAAILVVLGAVVAVARRGRRDEDRMVVRGLNDRFRELADALRSAVLGPKRFKKHAQAARKRRKGRGPAARRLFVLDFHGDLAATAVTSLRDEISAVLGNATEKDEVVLRLESSGGIVHAYGFAASQIARIKERKLRLVVCVDKIAASGGYMMACLADELVAAPFAVIGSIGVVAPVPNIHRLLERHGIDYEEMTAGQFKRTVSLLGEISPEGRQKYREQLEETHALFKEFVREHRPGLDIEQVSTGEYWFGTRAKELKLVDRLMTSDDYLLAQVEEADIFQVSFKPLQPWRRRFAGAVSESAAHAVVAWWSRLLESRFLA